MHPFSHLRVRLGNGVPTTSILTKVPECAVANIAPFLLISEVQRKSAG